MNTKQGTPDAAKERIAELEEVKRAYARDIHLLWAECDALRSRNAELVEALQGIANLALAPMVDMADPPEERARDWSHVAARAWETARAVLAKAPA